MRISSQKDTSPLTFKDFQEAVSWILREGFRLRLRSDGVVEVCHSLPGEGRSPKTFWTPLYPSTGS
ncbi:hypothetical protein [Thermogutta terrifontis]|uniref:hypothetical protein n=1 Tax=Thermogutta terrifontis TaxID=1331910 RepID=UPI000BA89486|nr:hypothetical protein [Thermogutta terrifontis]